MTTLYQNTSPTSSPSRIRNNMDPNLPSGNGPKYPSPRHPHTSPKRRVHTPPSRPSSQQQYYQQMNRNERSPDQNVFMDSEPMPTQNPKWKLFKSSDQKIYEHKKNGSDDSLPVMPTIAMGYENSIQNQLQNRGELRITNNGYFFEKTEEPRFRYGNPGYPPPPNGYQAYQQGHPSPNGQYQNYGYQQQNYGYQQMPGPYFPQPEYKEAISAPWEYEKFYNRYENHWKGFDISSQQAPIQPIRPQTPPEPLIHPVYDPEFRSKPREEERREFVKNEDMNDGFLKPQDPLNSSSASIKSRKVEDARPELVKDTSRDTFISRAGGSGGGGGDEKVDVESISRAKTPEILAQQVRTPVKQQVKQPAVVQEEVQQPVKIPKRKGLFKKMFSNEPKKKKKDKKLLTSSDLPSNQQLVVPKNLETRSIRQQQSEPASPGASKFSQSDRELQIGFPTSQIRSQSPANNSSYSGSTNPSPNPNPNPNEEITIMSTLSNIPILSNIFQRIDESSLTSNSKLCVKFLLIFWIMYEINSVFQIFSEYFELLCGIFQTES